MPRESREEWKIYKNVFDEFTIQTLFKLITQGHIDGLVGPVMIGKESNVYLAKKGDGHAIVKIYRLQSCNFNQMYSYIRSDPRFPGIKKNRRKIIFSWVQREYRNLLIAREKVNVPTPIAFMNNVIVMELIGDEKPAVQLKDYREENMDAMFRQVVKCTTDLYSQGLVHGDLSEFNILIYKDIPYLIDFSQGTAATDPNADELLKRDIKNICRFFRKCGIKADEDELYKEVTTTKDTD